MNMIIVESFTYGRVHRPVLECGTSYDESSIATVVVDDTIRKVFFHVVISTSVIFENKVNFFNPATTVFIKPPSM